LRGLAGFHDGKHTWRSELKLGSRGDEAPLARPPIRCPECASDRVWKDGVRYSGGKRIQRYLCRDCAYRFSESTAQRQVQFDVPSQVLEGFESQTDHADGLTGSRDLPVEKRPDHLPLSSCEDVGSHDNSQSSIIEEGLNKHFLYTRGRRVCVPEGGMVNLAEVKPQQEEAVAGAEQKLDMATIKGKVLEFGWWLKKQGYAEATIKLNTMMLGILARRGADIQDPESVKEIMAKQKWSEARRHNAIACYTLFLRMIDRTWSPPKCYVTHKLPFIPTEQEIDALIAGCGRKTATLLQLLKETAIRVGEASELEWTNIDFENRTITVNSPEKNSNPRIFKVSSKLISMINALRRESRKVFGDSPACYKKTTFYLTRKSIAKKLQNPRLLEISFHTLRHWKATMLYHQTKDILYVMRFLGHKSINNTLLYIQLAETIFKEQSDEFTVKTANAPEGIKSLLEVGFEYICEKDGFLYFRKRR